MSDTPKVFNNLHYEKACDQAIAMCDGNLRSTIKALIMANEYLESELLELQAAISSGCAPLQTPCTEGAAWQLAFLPGAPQYWRWAPTECFPCLGKLVSSETKIPSGPARVWAMCRRYRRNSA